MIAGGHSVGVGVWRRLVSEDGSTQHRWLQMGLSQWKGTGARRKS